MLRRLKNKLHKIEISIQMKLIAVFLIMTVVLFGVNVYIYSNLDEMMLQIEQVYASNTELNELQNILTLVQDDMTEYLNLRQTDSMENFYRDVTEYDKLALPVSVGPLLRNGRSRIAATDRRPCGNSSAGL